MTTKFKNLPYLKIELFWQNIKKFSFTKTDLYAPIYKNNIKALQVNLRAKNPWGDGTQMATEEIHIPDAHEIDLHVASFARYQTNSI